MLSSCPMSRGCESMTTEITQVDTIHEGWTQLLVASIRLPDGTMIRREIEDHGAAVCVLPYDPQRRTAMLVRLMRAPVLLTARQPEMLEAIAGLRDSDDPAACARREAHEEAGLALRDLAHVVTGWSMPGISTERMDLYLATYRPEDRVGQGGGLAHEHENITVVEMKLAELAALADAGELTDMKTLVLVQTLRLRRPELFV